MAKKNKPVQIESVKTVLGPETKFSGTMKFSHSLQIEGIFEGLIVSKGHLMIGKTAMVKADLKVGSVVIAGNLEGDIEASGEVEMLDTCQVKGDIVTRKLKISDGVSFDGKCRMLDSGEKIDVFSTSAEELKRKII